MYKSQYGSCHTEIAGSPPCLLLPGIRAICPFGSTIGCGTQWSAITRALVGNLFCTMFCVNNDQTNWRCNFPTDWLDSWFANSNSDWYNSSLVQVPQSKLVPQAYVEFLASVNWNYQSAWMQQPLPEFLPSPLDQTVKIFPPAGARQHLVAKPEQGCLEFSLHAQSQGPITNSVCPYKPWDQHLGHMLHWIHTWGGCCILVALVLGLALA